MKSIVEQASTVLKAIEKGWTQAGKPCEFTVKVYEHGVKNFFGMSVEPAKICILFEEKTSKSPAAKQHARQDSHTQSQQVCGPHQQSRKEFTSHAEQRKQSTQQPQQQRQQQPVDHQAPAQNRQKKEVVERPAQQPVSTKIIWSDELIAACNQWLTDTLVVMGKGDCGFTIEVKKYHLIITFSNDVLEDKEREKALFRSFAHVLMQSLRNRFKKGLRGYRIVLNTTHD